MSIHSGTETAEAFPSQSCFPFIKPFPLMLSLGKSSKMLRHTVNSIHTCVLCHVQRDKAAIQISFVTQGCSGQDVQAPKKPENNNQGQHWDYKSLKR